jgi:hypothetical protein
VQSPYVSIAGRHAEIMMRIASEFGFWPTKGYERGAVLAAAKSGYNLGVRLTAVQLVIDVDPRNGGVEGFKTLCRDLGLDPSKWPRVVTGSGGRAPLPHPAARCVGLRHVGEISGR